MSYLVADKSILEVSIRGRHQGQRILSVLHYQLDSGGVDQDGLAVIEAVNLVFNGVGPANFLKRYTDCIASTMTLEEVVYQWVHPVRRARLVKVPAIGAGSVIGPDMPANLAVALTKRSETAGRHGHGTLHMPALVRDNVDGGELTLLGTDLYGGLLTQLRNVINIDFGSNMTPIIFNRNAPLASVKITTAETQTNVRTMHRRTLRVGE